MLKDQSTFKCCYFVKKLKRNADSDLRQYLEINHALEMKKLPTNCHIS